MHQLKVHRVPEGSRTAKGAHIANLLPMEKEEYIANALCVRSFEEGKSFLFSTKKGMVKRSAMPLYARGRKGGIIAVGLRDDDELINVKTVQENELIMLATSDGMAIRFPCTDVREAGRSAMGVKGIALRGDDTVVACDIFSADDENSDIMTISTLGYGKRTNIRLYKTQSRGGRGLINFKATGKTGRVLGCLAVQDNYGLVLLTSTNKIIRISLEEVQTTGHIRKCVC